MLLWIIERIGWEALEILQLVLVNTTMEAMGILENLEWA